MANVTDSNFWRPNPLSDLPREAPASQPRAPVEFHAVDTPRDAEWSTLGHHMPLVELSMALRHLFDSGRDQLIWNLTGPNETSHAHLRFDRGHGAGAAAPTAGPRSDSAGNASGHPDSTPWLILVDRAGDLMGDNRAAQLQAARVQSPCLLMIACDAEETDPAAAALDTSTARQVIETSNRLGLAYVGPITMRDSRSLLEALSTIKTLGQPTLLHLRTRGPVIAGVGAQRLDSLPMPEAREETSGAMGSFSQVASQELARLARHDPRIIAGSTSAEPDLIRPWELTPHRMFTIDSDVPYALQWCSALALSGSRPFVFLSWEEVQNSFGQIRQEICLKRAAVTLIVEPRGEATSSDASGFGVLAGIRQLPHVCLLSPKDATELRAMLAWCASQHDPAVIWLPEATQPQVTWPGGTGIERGRAEQLTAGHDVAIVAWGPMVAAAQLAAESLALHGITASVVNARFAQPLDIDTISCAVRQALCAVIVDDSLHRGEFSSWILAHLLDVGITQSVSIVAPHGGQIPQHPHDAHNECAMRIVERCRWLAEPIAPPWQRRGDPPTPVVQSDTTASPQWLAPFSLPAARQNDEHQQVLAQQFSPFIQHWVRRYQEVGARDVYLWRWCLHGLGLITLSCVPPDVRQNLCDTKLLAVMYGVMLDDVADQGGDDAFLNELAKIIRGQRPRDFCRFSRSQQTYAQFTCELWESFESRLKCLPCFGEYEELLKYDHQQILNTMSYSLLVNRNPALLNVQEHDTYLPHNMQIMSFATMDLMASPAFDRRELGKLREVIWHAQSMGRIGNLVSTWQREIADRDFTSGVFARALGAGDLTLEDLRSASVPAIEAAIHRGGHELYFLRQWEAHHVKIEEMGPSILTVDVAALLIALVRLLHMELESRGFK